MQDILHIKFTNSPTFAANPGALIAKSLEIYHKLNADEVVRFEHYGVLPARLVVPAEGQGFDSFALAAAVRNIHETY